MARPKGSPNKITKQSKELINEALEGHMERIPEALDKLLIQSPKDYINAITSLLRFTTPTLKSVNVEQQQERPVVITLEPLSAEAYEAAKQIVNED
jgi:hypothetical protein